MNELAVHVVGAGRPLLLIHGGAEDADLLARQAAAFAATGRTVITYDRRGTGRSTRAGWPGGGVARHADDAARLLHEQGLAPATVLGFSSGGVIAIELAARHPEVVTTCLAWEPAALGQLPDGPEIHAQLLAPIEAYLREHPDDWTGGYHRMLDVLSEGRADLDSPLVAAQTRNAEAALRDDARIITRHRFPPERLRGLPVTVLVGHTPDPLHGSIALRLSGDIGRPPRTIERAADHEVYLQEPAVFAEALVDP